MSVLFPFGLFVDRVSVFEFAPTEAFDQYEAPVETAVLKPAALQLVEEAANLTYPCPPAKTETRVVGA